MYELYITNKNYSSWSLRPWALMEELAIPFAEKLVPFGEAAHDFTSFSPTGKVPCLVDGDLTIWESVSIIEYLAERHEGVWADDTKARAWSRSATAEMHAGFSTLRNQHPMTIGLRIRPNQISASLQNDISRVDALWQQGLSAFGGPFLAGETFTAVDAFFCPVAFRFQTYGTVLSEAGARYNNLLLSVPAMTKWQTAALQEVWRDAGHEAEARAVGEWLEDLRGN
ncbi:glutathione S-transferase family protein [Agrobacterium rubi]|uniref:Glutathione S-transferase family protein n=1 Tax=Agrobacterium rubi TaxID=28099 RepID=A0AAE7R7Y7_9HYPH|nr:glutathione S-transferase family protein [Agrobacterium rubi]NTE86310.1 glutathione S-transferase family protein [Agrobacterium rubi]NTF02242.1 glutathione S-transferase family protein [Agrobacterium rubi]NTF36486.1 glutathione S-transferase family protein [Agrobacterium rubi]OCJ44258.1 glutathione S-transferase [Agrobacterium rubi]QTF98953.1 glutathione S-transferase family protein [Agrobacterium rubi]